LCQASRYPVTLKSARLVNFGVAGALPQNARIAN
jgi:hypothetical protein